MGTASIARPGPLASHLMAIFALAGMVPGTLAEPAFAQEDQGSWDTLAPVPTPRRLMAAAVAGDAANGTEAIYTFGGCGSPCFDPPLHTSTFEETRLEVFENGSWSVREPIPAILFGAAAATVNGKIYLFGGYVTGGDTYEYDPKGYTWRRRAPMPTPRHGLAAVALDGKVYVLGGSNGSAATGALEIYNPADNSWSHGASMPTPRAFFAAAAVDKKIYAIGGSPDGSDDGNGNATGRTDVVEVYDTETKSWSRVGWLPVALQVSAAVTLNDKIYVFGGFIPGSGVQGSTFEYNPKETEHPWALLKPMLEARDQAPAVVLGDLAHVLGGSVDCHCKARGTHDSYKPPLIDVGIVKTSDPPGAISSGTVVTYTITVTNLGSDAVSGVIVTDSLKKTGLLGVQWCRRSGDTCPLMPGDLSDTITLAANGSVTYEARGTLASTARGTLSNTAEVHAPGDQNPENDQDMATNSIIPVTPCSVSITKIADRRTAAPGDILRYTITVENSCPQTMQATVTDGLAATGLTGSGWCCGSGCNPSQPGDVSETVSLPARGAVTCTVVGTVPCACGKSQIDNEACVTVGQTATCDSTTVPILPAPGGDLVLTAKGADPLENCGPLPYTFTVTNKGPGIACGAVLQVQPPTGSALVSISIPCVGLSCNLGNLAPGQKVQVAAAFSIPADARCAVPLATTASVNACSSAADKIETTLPCILSVTKSDGRDTAAPGDALLYTIGITNQSCAAVSGAKVMDVFPAELQNVKWCKKKDCEPSSPAASLNDSLDLPFGGQETYRARGTVSLAFTGTLSNTVTVTPPGSSEVSATDKTEISAAAPRGLTPSCEALSGTPSEGGMITKTFVISNDGPAPQGDNPGPEFEDALPAGLTLTGAVPSSGTVMVDLGTNTVSWNGSLPPGGMVTLQVMASINVGTAGMKICNGGTAYFDADGDGVNESSRPVPAPCCFRVLLPGEAPPIPSLSGPGLAALALLLSLLALLQLRRRNRTG